MYTYIYIYISCPRSCHHLGFGELRLEATSPSVREVRRSGSQAVRRDSNNNNNNNNSY